MPIESNGRNESTVQPSGAASLVWGAPPAAFSLDAGTVFGGRFTIIRLIAHGGMGSIYLAKDTHTGEEVCLKLVRSELLATPSAVDRFLTEGKLARRLSHPNIARVFDIDRKEGIWFISMEYANGATLRQWIQNRRNKGETIRVEDALWVARRVLDALDHLHRNNVLHRDIKPDNIIIAEDEAAGGKGLKLVDFGLATSLRDDLLSHPTMANVVGTPGYIAPEIKAGGRGDHRSDLYGVGAVLYEMLSGAAYDGNWEYISDVRDDVPPALDDELRAVLSKFPEARPDTAKDMLQYLERAAKDKSRPAAGATASAATSVSADRGGQKQSGKLIVLAWVALALCGVLTISNLYLWSEATSMRNGAASHASHVEQLLREGRADRTATEKSKQELVALKKEFDATASDVAAVLAAGGNEAARDELISRWRDDLPRAERAGDRAELARDAAVGAAENADASSAQARRAASEAERSANLAREAASATASRSSSGPAVPAGKEGWREIQIGMTKEQVRQLLGEPNSRKADSPSEYWLYNRGGHTWDTSVRFYGGKVDSFQEPK